jgi:hypothetical protein
LAGIGSASVQRRIALGPRAGARVLQLGREPNALWVRSRGPCQAHLEGFDLHANITLGANDRPGLERLCRYVLRPPVAQDRLALTPDGLVLVTLKSEWADGTTALLFTPVEFLTPPGTGAPSTCAQPPTRTPLTCPPAVPALQNSVDSAFVRLVCGPVAAAGGESDVGGHGLIGGLR